MKGVRCRGMGVAVKDKGLSELAEINSVLLVIGKYGPRYDLMSVTGRPQKLTSTSRGRAGRFLAKWNRNQRRRLTHHLLLFFISQKGPGHSGVISTTRDQI